MIERVDRARRTRAEAAQDHYSRGLSWCALDLQPRPGQSRRRRTSRQTQRSRNCCVADVWLCTIPLEVTTNYHARAKRFTASLPRDRALAILKKTNEAGRPMWTEGVRGPEAGMVIHQIMVERAQAWVWHEKPRERQPTAASQPPPATEFHLQPDFTPRAVDTWATEIRRGRMLCRTYQQNQY